MVSFRKHVASFLLSVLTLCADVCVVFERTLRAVIAVFDVPVSFAIAVVVAVARAVPTLYVETKRSHDMSMQLAGYGHVAMLKGLGA